MSYQNSLSKVNREQAKRRFYPLWRYLGEVLLEPIIFASAIYLLFAQIQNLISKAPDFFTFLQMLDEDMASNMFAYIFFGLIFITWVAYRLRIRTLEFRDREETKRLNTETLETLKELKKQAIIRRVSSRISRR